MMPTIQVRDVPDYVVRGLEMQAAAAGMSREAWLREQLETLATGPIVRERYAIRYRGTHNHQSIEGLLVRGPQGSSSLVGGFPPPTLSPEQYAMHLRAEKLIWRNGPGDREQALRMLRTVFDTVIEEAPPEPVQPPHYEAMSDEQKRAFADRNKPE